MKLKEKFGEQLRGLRLERFDSLLDLADVFEIGEPVPKNQAANAILLGGAVSAASALKLLAETRVGHFVQASRADFLYELLLSCMIMGNLDAFLNDPQPFLFAPRGGKGPPPGERRAKTFEFRASTEKAGLIHGIENFGGRSDLTRPFVDRCLTIADELASNALFAAPVGGDGEALFKHLPRDARVAYPDKYASARMVISHDSRRLLLACVDPFGSLNRDLLLAKMTSAYGKDGMATPQGGSGAGLGCRLMVESSTEFYAVVRPGKLSLVCCSFAIDSGLRAIDAMPKHLHVDVRR